MESRVSGRGTITVDRELRRQLGVRPGMIAQQRVVGDRLEVVFLPDPHGRSLFGVLHNPDEPILVADGGELEEAVMEAIAVNASDGHESHSVG